MNKYNLEITFKDICSVTHNSTQDSEELVVGLFDGSTIKAHYYKEPPVGHRDFRLSNEKYEALNKVVVDYLECTRIINKCHARFQEMLEEAEARLEE